MPKCKTSKKDIKDALQSPRCALPTRWFLSESSGLVLFKCSSCGLRPCRLHLERLHKQSYQIMRSAYRWFNNISRMESAWVSSGGRNKQWRYPDMGHKSLQTSKDSLRTFEPSGNSGMERVYRQHWVQRQKHPSKGFEGKQLILPKAGRSQTRSLRSKMVIRWNIACIRWKW